MTSQGRETRSDLPAGEGGVYGTKRLRSQWHKEYGSTVYRAGGPIPKRQNYTSGSNTCPYRRDPAPGHRRCGYHGRRHKQGSTRPQAEHRDRFRHHHNMSIEATFATTTFMGDSYTFVDCPGSIEFIQDMRNVLPAVDAAVVVCEADEKKVPQLQLILRELEDQNIPRFIFLNKIDRADKRVRE